MTQDTKIEEMIEEFQKLSYDIDDEDLDTNHPVIPQREATNWLRTKLKDLDHAVRSEERQRIRELVRVWEQRGYNNTYIKNTLLHHLNELQTDE